jgi:hypothetical protein
MAAEAVTASRPSAVEIRFSPNIMGVSFSRVDPTQPEGERRAGRVVQVGESSINPECSVRSASAAGNRRRPRPRQIRASLSSAERAEQDASGNGLDRADRKDVEAGRTSPLFPSVAKTIARVLSVVKSLQKKIGAG